MFTVLCVSANDRESLLRTDWGFTDKFYREGRLANADSANDEAGQYYFLNGNSNTYFLLPEV